MLATGRWKKRYLALEDGLLKMYKDKGHTTGIDRKTLELDPVRPYDCVGSVYETSGCRV